MPKGWLEEDLSSGLDDNHLWPNGECYFLLLTEMNEQKPFYSL